MIASRQLDISDSPPTYEEVVRSKEIILKQKLNIMRNQLETLEDYAQLGFKKPFNSCVVIWIKISK